MKKIVILAVIIVFVLSMAFTSMSCKEEAASTTDEATEESAVEAEEEETEEATEEVKTEEIKLLLWSFGIFSVTLIEQENAKDESEWYINEAIARFEDANPGIKVEYFEEEGKKSTELLTATGMAGSGPDVIGLWGGTNVLNVKDILLPLNDFFTEEEMEQNKGWEFHMEDGNYYGCPITTQVSTIYINKSLFEQAGVDPSEYDGTYDSFFQLCEKIKNAGIVPLCLGVADGWANSFLEGSLYSSQVADAESEFKEMAKGNSNFADNEELITAFKAVQDLYSNGFFNDDVATINFDEATTKFAAGEAAMYCTATWDVTSLENIFGEDLGVIPMPSISADSVNFGTTIGGQGVNAVCVTNYSEHPEEAMRLLKFLRSYEEEKERFKKTGQLPSILGDYSDVVISPILGELSKMTNVTFFLDNLLPGDTAGRWFAYESLMLTGEMSVEDFLSEWDIARDEALMAE